ncbi:MAG: hypothetical protein PVG07_15460 [Acidobacteriota bacterium]
MPRLRHPPATPLPSPPRAPALGLFLALTLILILTPAPAAAAGFQVAPAGEPPAELAPALREALAAEGTLVRDGEEPVLRVWLRASPAGSGDSGGGGGELGVAFGSLPEGGLLGVVALERPWVDYREQTVAPGLYTLRYLVEPVDGAHMGVSYYRDFVLLVPAADDAGPEAAYAEDELVAASRAAAGTNHPAVMALFPVAADGAPTIVDNEMGQPTLALRMPGSEEGDQVGLVVEGTGEM